jgi:hypothetical protein
MRRYLIWRTLSIKRSRAFADASLSRSDLARWTLFIILQPLLAFSQMLYLPFVKWFKIRILRLGPCWLWIDLRGLCRPVLLFLFILCIVIIINEFRWWNRSERELILLFGRGRLFCKLSTFDIILHTFIESFEENFTFIWSIFLMKRFPPLTIKLSFCFSLWNLTF